MKKILLSLALVLSINCYSQIQKPISKGNSIISGGATIQLQKDQFTDNMGTAETSHYIISLTPGFAYFLINNLAVGVNTSFLYNGATNNKFYTLGLGPLLRYYFNNGIFLKADMDYSYIHNISSSTDNVKFLSVLPGAGYAFFLNQKVSLEPAVCYEFDNIKYNSTNTQKTNSVRLELRLSIFL